VEAGAAAEGGSRRRPAAEGIGLSREGVMQGRFKLLITLDRLKGSLRRCTRGQHGQRPDDGEKSTWRSSLPAKVPSGNSIVTEA
jgi:hypothetical protein